jgi:hypothetical protein
MRRTWDGSPPTIFDRTDVRRVSFPSSPIRRFDTLKNGRILALACHVYTGGAGARRRGNIPSNKLGGRRTLFFYTGRSQEGVPHGDVRRGVCRVRGGHNARGRRSQAEEGASSCQLISQILPRRQRRGTLGRTDGQICPGGPSGLAPAQQTYNRKEPGLLASGMLRTS